MALQSYGVLKGRVAAYQLATPEDLHFHLLIEAAGANYRASINVRSRRAPSLLEYVVDERFEHRLLAGLPALPEGYTALSRRPDGSAIDYIRGGIFAPSSMRPLPYDRPGPNNDLNELIEGYARWALAAPGALVYAFGEPWGPDYRRRDDIFGFTPGRGMHNIHMNQASGGRFQFSDGIWQDGALLFHFPQPAQWAAIFLKFQSQSWRSDPRTGRRFRSDRRFQRRR